MTSPEEETGEAPRSKRTGKNRLHARSHQLSRPVEGADHTERVACSNALREADLSFMVVSETGRP